MTESKEFVPMIQRFNGENFPVWKFQMTLIFGSRDLTAIIDGTEKRPNGDNSNDAVAAWIKRDMSASSILAQTIEQEILKTLVGCKTTAEIWSTLNTLQDKQALQSIDKLQRKFFELKFDGKSGCYNFISSITLFISQLKNIGDENFNDRSIMTQILSSLPKTYNLLITAWNLLPKEQQSLETLKLKLLEKRSS